MQTKIREITMELDGVVWSSQNDEKVKARVRLASQEDISFLESWNHPIRSDALDKDWSWQTYYSWYSQYPDYWKVFVVEAASDIQGLRLIQVQDVGEKDKPSIKIYGPKAIASSVRDWNRPPERRFSGTGSLLVGATILQSIEAGYGGRFFCESLPGSEGFHQRNGMTTFSGYSKHNHQTYRFTDKSAKVCLEKIRERYSLTLAD